MGEARAPGSRRLSRAGLTSAQLPSRPRDAGQAGPLRGCGASGFYTCGYQACLQRGLQLSLRPSRGLQPGTGGPQGLRGTWHIHTGLSRLTIGRAWGGGGENGQSFCCTKVAQRSPACWHHGGEGPRRSWRWLAGPAGATRRAGRPNVREDSGRHLTGGLLWSAARPAAVLSLGPCKGLARERRGGRGGPSQARMALPGTGSRAV